VRGELLEGEKFYVFAKIGVVAKMGVLRKSAKNFANFRFRQKSGLKKYLYTVGRLVVAP
jgi:hypothetical protein